MFSKLNEDIIEENMFFSKRISHKPAYFWCFMSILSWRKLRKLFVTLITAQRSFGKALFSAMSVCLFTGEGSHVTINHDALDLTVQVPPPNPRLTWDLTVRGYPQPQPPPPDTGPFPSRHGTSLYRDTSPC